MEEEERQESNVDPTLVSAPKRLNRIKMTPEQSALSKLAKQLESFPELSRETKGSIIRDMEKLPNLKYMNMEMLALANVVASRMNLGEDKAAFDLATADMHNYLIKTSDALSMADKERASKEDLLRYLIAVFSVRNVYDTSLEPEQEYRPF